MSISRSVLRRLVRVVIIVVSICGSFSGACAQVADTTSLDTSSSKRDSLDPPDMNIAFVRGTVDLTSGIFLTMLSTGLDVEGFRIVEGQYGFSAGLRGSWQRLRDPGRFRNQMEAYLVA